MIARVVRSIALGSLLTMLACTTNRLDVGDKGASEDDLAVPPTHKGFVDRVDLLFVVDNSLSMADKHAELARRVPELIKTLTAPDIDPLTGKPVHRPVRDLHVAFISSSLGSYGASSCDPRVTNLHNDDRAHLLPRAGEQATSGWKVERDAGEPIPNACPTLSTASTLTWSNDPSDTTAQFHGTDGSTEMQIAASCVMQTVREQGCGYEAPLEAMYRFLVDPAPYATAAAKCMPTIPDACEGEVVASGLDEQILAQRAAFLRPDSLLAVVLLSDENDASFQSAGNTWQPLGANHGGMPRGWAACAKVPDDVEDNNALAALGCRSCSESASDASCATPWPSTAPNVDSDIKNLRAFHQVQRYGRSFLWPVQRYIDGFTKRKVIGRDGKLLPNPIFEYGRSLDLVVVAGILGVPPSLVNDSTGMPKPLTEADWTRAVSPDPTKRDPHMIESIVPRAGLARYVDTRTIDPVHGGERDTYFDLQYACIGVRHTASASDECGSPQGSPPLCTSGLQTHFKAYPSVRELRVIHGIAGSGFVASICDSTYRGAVAGIVRKIQEGCEGE